jgi:hypothetical protein
MTAGELPPKSLTVELPLAPPYSDEAVNMTKQTVMATLDLSGGHSRAHRRALARTTAWR